jgi:hypothetical protein
MNNLFKPFSIEFTHLAYLEFEPIRTLLFPDDFGFPRRENVNNECFYYF